MERRFKTAKKTHVNFDKALRIIIKNKKIYYNNKKIYYNNKKIYYNNKKIYYKNIYLKIIFIF